MDITIFSDPHLGLNRTTNTTAASRKRLKDSLNDTVVNVLERTPGKAVCLGDLFDTYITDGKSLVHGWHVFNRCNLVLFGNHDLANRVDTLSAIEVVAQLSSDAGRHACGIARASQWKLDLLSGLTVWWVDHKLTQGIFEGAVQDAFDRAKKGDVLLLHCNYDSPFATQESSLNLTRDIAGKLLDKFSCIFIGHEHQSRKDFGGRLILTGNTHPTSLSDVSDKFVWTLTVNNGTVESVSQDLIWSKEKGYLTLDWSDLDTLNDVPADLQFVDVTGFAKLEDMPGIAKKVADLWTKSDNLLVVRNNVATLVDNMPEVSPEIRCRSIPDQVTAELQGTDLFEVWQEYRGRL